jgi:hypothetical protein
MSDEEKKDVEDEGRAERPRHFFVPPSLLLMPGKCEVGCVCMCMCICMSCGITQTHFPPFPPLQNHTHRDSEGVNSFVQLLALVFLVGTAQGEKKQEISHGHDGTRRLATPA